ncbi:MAG: hypothetical protein ACKPKO_48535, partial [Candidatus Fonsibacter sp.]
MLQNNAQYPLDTIHPEGGMVDLWLMDDQTIVLEPSLINTSIDAVDHACQTPTQGGIRNRTKTHAIIYATPEQHQSMGHTWDLDQIRRKAILNVPTDRLKTLGATLGGRDNRVSEFRKKRLKVMQAMHHKLTTLNDPAVELKLTRHCLGESKVQHLLRMYGSQLHEALRNA